MDGTYRISHLSRLAGRAFEELDIDQNSARVRQIPDVRTIRYYTTLGLLDRPAEMKGRTAFYKNRHLMQLIAIKRLQSDGKTLVEVQQHMTAIGATELESLAAVPRGFFKKVDQWLAEESANDSVPKGARRRKVGPSEATSKRGAFWTETPTVSDADSQDNKQPVAIRASTVLQLAHNVSLHIDGVTDNRLDDGTVSLLQPVLKELTSILQSAGLTSHGSTNGENT